jgi:hypothetical protein
MREKLKKRNNLQSIIKFWNKYEGLSLKITLILISLQIIHLYWLTTDVVFHKIFGKSFFIFPTKLLAIFIIIDYLEIPALVSGTIFYSFKVWKILKEKHLFF